MTPLLKEFEALGGYDYEYRMERVLDGVGLPEETLATPASDASGGERTRAALARALLSDPDFLILDEPTNYLDFRGLDWLEDFLSGFTGGFMVVSHDRYFLDKVATRILEIDDGKLRSFPGNFTKYRALKEEQHRRQLIEYERQQEYIAREEAFIRRYKAGQRAREARGRATRLERLERIEKPHTSEEIHLGSLSAFRTGQIAVRTSKLAVGYQQNGSRRPAPDRSRHPARTRLPHSHHRQQRHWQDHAAEKPCWERLRPSQAARTSATTSSRATTRRAAPTCRATPPSSTHS